MRGIHKEFIADSHTRSVTFINFQYLSATASIMIFEFLLHDLNVVTLMIIYLSRTFITFQIQNISSMSSHAGRWISRCIGLCLRDLFVDRLTSSNTMKLMKYYPSCLISPFELTLWIRTIFIDELFHFVSVSEHFFFILSMWMVNLSMLVMILLSTINRFQKFFIGCGDYKHLLEF